MRPGADYQPRLARFGRGSVRTHLLKVTDSAGQENIVPAASVEAGHVDLGMVAQDRWRRRIFLREGALDAIKERFAEIGAAEWFKSIQRQRLIALSGQSINLAC